MIHELRRWITSKLTFLDEHTLEVVQKSSASLVVKALGMGIGFLISVALGRFLGPEGLGIINLSKQITGLLVVFGMVGYRQAIIKEVSISYTNKNWERLGNVMYTAYWVTGGITLMITIVSIFFTPWLASEVFDEPKLTFPLMVALIVMVPQVFSRIFSSGLIGFRKIWQSNLVDQTLSSFVTGGILFFLWYNSYEINVNRVAIAYGIGKVVVTISIGFYWKAIYSYDFKRELVFKKLFKLSFPLFIVAITAILISKVPVVLLGWIANSREVGLYTVAVKMALLSSFFLSVTNSTVGPKIAALFEKGKIKEMERMIQQVTKGLTLIGGIPLILFFLFGADILGIWGSEFKEAYWLLNILALGQFVNLATGAVGLIMIMTGHERVQSRLSMAFAVLNVLLAIIFISLYGAIGAAISTAIIFAVSNLTQMFFVRHLLNIRTITFINW